MPIPKKKSRQKVSPPPVDADVMIVQPDPQPGMAECPIVLEEGQQGGFRLAAF